MAGGPRGGTWNFAVLILWLAIPAMAVAYLFRFAQTILLGVRSMNARLERISEAVEALAEAERRRSS